MAIGVLRALEVGGVHAALGADSGMCGRLERAVPVVGRSPWVGSLLFGAAAGQEREQCQDRAEVPTHRDKYRPLTLIAASAG